ncbi:unnamed protein product [Miscanthus lutarioriparius]|uniref:No apical meristem-associated C-terminal domain-containing protein n=1 Tax=Miscanthus lutarioriparius TaxID=422564 RepID=A0A811QH87_9POAL|nr:unnamed protein product [Miscanthus lutarioriparius]
MARVLPPATTPNQVFKSSRCYLAIFPLRFGLLVPSILGSSLLLDRGRDPWLTVARGLRLFGLVLGFLQALLICSPLDLLPKSKPGQGTSLCRPAAATGLAGTLLEGDKDTQGGFMRYFGNQPHNFHLVGAHCIPETNGGSLPSEVELLSEQHPVLVNGENENVRTEKWIMWTPNEDERLMSAWIENSTDSATGANRKSEAYGARRPVDPAGAELQIQLCKGGRLHEEYELLLSLSAAASKTRKGSAAARVFTSGYSDQMWMDAADEFYLDHKLGPFMIKNVWKICRDVAKWKTYNEELKNARKRKSYHLEEDASQRQWDDGKSKESAIHVEKLDKLSKSQEEAITNRMKVLELEQKLSSDKIETTRLAHLAAQENRESKKLEMEGRRLEMESKKLEMEGKKLEKESKMMDAYNNLISQDTSSMTDDEKSERVAAMKCLRKMLFPEVI